MMKLHHQKHTENHWSLMGMGMSDEILDPKRKKIVSSQIRKSDDLLSAQISVWRKQLERETQHIVKEQHELR